jgi:hypothetical protein
VELLVAHDGGIPCVRQRWDGKPADSEVVQARTQALLAALKKAPRPRYVLADSTRDHEDHAIHLRHLGFITRMPSPIGSVSEAIMQARAWDSWQRLDDHTRSQRLELCHDGMAQRWLVVSSQAALERAEATLNHARPRADEALHRPLLHLQAQRDACGGPRGADGSGQGLDSSPGRLLPPERPSTLRASRPPDTAPACEGQRLAKPGPRPAG